MKTVRDRFKASLEGWLEFKLDHEHVDALVRIMIDSGLMVVDAKDVPPLKKTGLKYERAKGIDLGPEPDFEDPEYQKAKEEAIKTALSVTSKRA